MSLTRNQTQNLLICWTTLQPMSHPTRALLHSYYMPTLPSRQWRLRMRKDLAHGDSCSWDCWPWVDLSYRLLCLAVRSGSVCWDSMGNSWPVPCVPTDGRLRQGWCLRWCLDRHLLRLLLLCRGQLWSGCSTLPPAVHDPHGEAQEEGMGLDRHKDHPCRVIIVTITAATNVCSAWHHTQASWK